MIWTARRAPLVKRRIGKARALLRRSVVRVLATDNLRSPRLAAAVEDLLLPTKPVWRRGRSPVRRSGRALFARELFTNPRAVGAACPSSRWLASSMVRWVPRRLEGRVVELGGGTGVVTAALLRRGVAAEQLVVLERSRTLAAHLRRRFPQLQVIRGDAAFLSDLLPADGVKVCAVVSSLPLRSLPRETVRQIMLQLECILAPGALFIQYTYALRSACSQFPDRFRQTASKIVWRNLPPARVDVYRV